MEKQNYKYEVALSYAHNDGEIADLLSIELEKIFADKYFRDCLMKHELTNASEFKKKLQDIFRDSRYAIVLYSKNYEEAQFTQVELEQIKNKNRENFILINLNEENLPKSLEGAFYLCLSKDRTKQKDEIKTLINENIKPYIMYETLKRRNEQNKYSLNIQTLFMAGNIPQWYQRYDWNLLTYEYICDDGRKIKDSYTWNELWEHVKKDYLIIKKELNNEPRTFREIRLNCHLSVAYKLGQIYGDLSQGSGNRNLLLESSNNKGGIKFEFSTQREINAIDDFCVKYDGNNDCTDIVCIISIKPNADENIISIVKDSLNDLEIDYQKLYLFQKKTTIGDTNQLESIAEYLNCEMQKYRTDKKNCTIHLFLDTLAPLAFVLGGQSVFHGKVNLYEFLPAQVEYVMALTRE